MKKAIILAGLAMLVAMCGRPAGTPGAADGAQPSAASALTARTEAAGGEGRQASAMEAPGTVQGNRFAGVLDTLYGRLFYAIAETGRGDSILLIAHRTAITEIYGRNLAARWAWIYGPDTTGRIVMYGVTGRPESTQPLAISGECLLHGDSLRPSAVTIDFAHAQLVPDSLSHPAPEESRIIRFADIGNEE